MYRDGDRVESGGNILDALAPLFPPTVRERVSAGEPIMARWHLMVRTMRAGPVGHFLRTEPWVVARLKGLFEEVYRGYPREEDGPFVVVFNEGYRDGLPMVCVSLAAYKPRITVWLPGPPAACGVT